MSRLSCLNGRSCLFTVSVAVFLLAWSHSFLEGAPPKPTYEGFVTLLYDGRTTNELQFVGGVAPEQTESSLLVTDVQPQQEAWFVPEVAVGDFDLWVEVAAEETEYGSAGSAYSFSLTDDSGRMVQTWGIPAVNGTREKPTLIHISRRGDEVSFRDAPVKGAWSQPIKAVADNHCCRARLKFESGWGQKLHVLKITLGEPGVKSLFNQADLSGWEGYPGSATESWSVNEGLLNCNGVGKTWLRSAQQYGDFNLRFDYRLKAGGNSGLFIRVPADGNHHRENATLPPAGLEIQLLDDADEQYRTLKDYQYSASVYDIVGASPRVSRPAGTWNSFQIDAKADRLQVWHNGQKVVDADEEKFPLLALRLREGFLGLQNHASVISFRNLRIGSPLGN